jgi:hypothetical protein
MTEQKQETKKKEEYVLVEVPTGSALAYRTPEGEVLTEPELLIHIANEIRETKEYLIK